MTSWVTVYPHGIGRAVERGEVVTVADLEIKEPLDPVARAEVLAALIAASERGGYVVVSPLPMAPPVAARSRCVRCGGPAYAGLLTVECERTGGCRTAEERVADAEVGGADVQRAEGRRGEAYWIATDARVHTYHPSRELAVESWRARRLARERLR